MLMLVPNKTQHEELCSTKWIEPHCYAPVSVMVTCGHQTLTVK